MFGWWEADQATASNTDPLSVSMLRLRLTEPPPRLSRALLWARREPNRSARCFDVRASRSAPGATETAQLTVVPSFGGGRYPPVLSEEIEFTLLSLGRRATPASKRWIEIKLGRYETNSLRYPAVQKAYDSKQFHSAGQSWRN